MAIEFVPIQDAPDSLIHECVESVLDSVDVNSPIAERMWARVQAIREGEFPAACDMLLKGWQGVGWSGWFPLWTNPYAAWSSATYLAPSLRGKGLLPILRCRQAHAALEIFERMEGDVEFVSSIEATNTQSLRASMKYARRNKWPNSWYLYDDRSLDRIMLRMMWPDPPMPHECYMGLELPSFEDPIEEIEVELSTDLSQDDLRLTTDTWVRNRAAETWESFEDA